MNGLYTNQHELRSCKYEILKNILFLNKKLFLCQMVNTESSFYNKQGDTPLHTFTEFISVNYLW